MERLYAAAIREAVQALKDAGVASPDLGRILSRGMEQNRVVSRQAINKWEREESRAPADALRGAALALNMTEAELLARAGLLPPYVTSPKRRRRKDFVGPAINS